MWPGGCVWGVVGWVCMGCGRVGVYGGCAYVSECVGGRVLVWVSVGVYGCVCVSVGVCACVCVCVCMLCTVPWPCPGHPGDPPRSGSDASLGLH